MKISHSNPDWVRFLNALRLTKLEYGLKLPFALIGLATMIIFPLCLIFSNQGIISKGAAALFTAPLVLLSIVLMRLHNWAEQRANYMRALCTLDMHSDTIGPVLEVIYSTSRGNKRLVIFLEELLRKLVIRLERVDLDLLDDRQIEQIRAIIGKGLVDATLQSLERGEPMPPWQRYGNAKPCWRPWREDEWWDQTWMPFFNELSNEEQAAYFDRYGAPEEWREWIVVSISLSGRHKQA